MMKLNTLELSDYFNAKYCQTFLFILNLLYLILVKLIVQ